MIIEAEVSLLDWAVSAAASSCGGTARLEWSHVPLPWMAAREHKRAAEIAVAGERSGSIVTSGGGSAIAQSHCMSSR